MVQPGQQNLAVKTWLIIILLVLIVLVQGGLSYFIIGDRGQPDWDYRPVPDVPGESPYAIYQPLPFPQHVKGEKTDYPQPAETDDKRLYPPPDRAMKVNQ
ncbi:MAG: hypothetical protein PVI06_03805 [Desulfobacterales bacterium]|jgi:hypothetical protein